MLFLRLGTGLAEDVVIGGGDVHRLKTLPAGCRAGEHTEGRVLAFVGLERTLTSAMAVFDVTDPFAVEYIDMIVSEGDISPECLHAFRVGSRYYVAVADEVSDTTSLFEITLRHGRSEK